MFDVGFSELIVIGIVALVVIGPERLPGVARTAGHLLGRLQRYVSDVKSDISREMQLDELKKLQSEMQDSARSLEQSFKGEMRSVEQSVEQTWQSVQSAPQDSPATTTEHPASEVQSVVSTGAAASLDSGERTAPENKAG